VRLCIPLQQQITQQPEPTPQHQNSTYVRRSVNTIARGFVGGGNSREPINDTEEAST